MLLFIGMANYRISSRSSGDHNLLLGTTLEAMEPTILHRLATFKTRREK